MTVNELYKCWQLNGNTNGIVKIWSLKQSEYIVNSEEKHEKEYFDEIEQMIVVDFNVEYNLINEKYYLYINVR